MRAVQQLASQPQGTWQLPIGSSLYQDLTVHTAVCRSFRVWMPEWELAATVWHLRL